MDNKQGGREEAWTKIEKALAHDPEHGASWDTKGVVLFKLDRIEEAETAFKKTLKIAPGHPIAQYHLAKVYEKSGRSTEAKALLDGSFEPTDEISAKIKKKLSFKAPIALNLAAELIEKSRTTPIEEGIELELGSLTKIFSTEDARTGLGSVGKGRPVFSGK